MPYAIALLRGIVKFALFLIRLYARKKRVRNIKLVMHSLLALLKVDASHCMSDHCVVLAAALCPRCELAIYARRLIFAELAKIPNFLAKEL